MGPITGGRVVACLLAMLAAAAPAVAQEAALESDLPVPIYEAVTVEPASGGAVEYRGRAYGGTLEVRAHDDGLAVVERTDIEGYLAGIREVPFSWPDDALAAQVVAARSYLASDLARGRSSNGRKYGYDICATTACQVYAGAGLEAEEGGERWVAAIAATAGEILVHDGGPARTFYHSTSGGRTEPVQDVWAGSTPVPYLVGADSPGEPSPFADWRVALPADAFARILAADGIELAGDLQAVEIVPRPPGGGVWRVRLVAGGEATVVDIAEIRGALNRHGSDLYPELLPARRANGRRYPQAILSYRFDVTMERPRADLSPGIRRFVPEADLPPETSVVVEGRGWGHHVGMSQYGALAMARSGAGYADILAHYYGGLRPQDDGGALPEEVAVGLAWEQGEVVVGGPVRVSAGSEVLVGDGRPWRFLSDGDGGVAVMPPLARLRELLGPRPAGPPAVWAGLTGRV